MAELTEPTTGSRLVAPVPSVSSVVSSRVVSVHQRVSIAGGVYLVGRDPSMDRESIMGADGRALAAPVANARRAHPRRRS